MYQESNVLSMKNNIPRLVYITVGDPVLRMCPLQWCPWHTASPSFGIQSLWTMDLHMVQTSMINKYIKFKQYSVLYVTSMCFTSKIKPKEQICILCFLFGQLILQRDFGTLDFRNLFLQLRLSLLGLWKHSFGLLVLLSQFFEVLQLQPSFCIVVLCALLQSSTQTLYLVFVALQFLLGTQLAVEGNRGAAICTALHYLKWMLNLLWAILYSDSQVYLSLICIKHNVYNMKTDSVILRWRHI